MHFQSVYGIEKLTMLDYPNNLSAILFYGGCSIRCPYCYNAGIVNCTIPQVNPEWVDTFITSRVNKLDAIVFSGGECTIHGERLYNDIAYCRSLGYKIKLDTNGTNHGLVKKLIDDNMLDYVALDYKCPEKKLQMFKFNQSSYSSFKTTLGLLCGSSIPFEVRTTIHTDIISEQDIMEIISDLDNIGYVGNYYLQFHFRGAEETLGNVSNSPREFNIEKISGTNNITIQYRNIQDNF